MWLIFGAFKKNAVGAYSSEHGFEADSIHFFSATNELRVLVPIQAIWRKTETRRRCPSAAKRTRNVRIILI
jgi:hypothetical protein